MWVKALRVLIAEDEEYLREFLEFLISHEVNADILSVGSGKEAIEALDSDADFDVIVCDFNMPNGKGSEVLNHIIKKQLSVRFILCSSEGPEVFEDIDESRIYGYVAKPNVGDPLVQMIKNVQLELQRTKVSKADEKAGFVRIPAAVIRDLFVEPIDVYQKIGTSQYIKIVDNKYLSTSSELRGYMDRGVSHFFVDKIHAPALMQNYWQLVRSEFGRRQLSVTETIDFLKASSEVVKQLSESLGWTEELMDLTNRNLSIVVSQLQKRGDLASQVKRFSIGKESYYGAHSALTAYVAIGLCKTLRWESFDSNYKMAMAAFLHDIFLTDNEILNRKDYLNEISRGSQMPWLEGTRLHGVRAAQLLKSWPEAPLGVDLILTQHHENPNGSGFPNGIDHELIGPLSALFILAEDLVDWSIDEQEEGRAVDLGQFVASRKQRYKDGHFQVVYQAMVHDLSEN
jgi:response regulator RpfG family c-di-GMP phosphodiesterase